MLQKSLIWVLKILLGLILVPICVGYGIKFLSFVVDFWESSKYNYLFFSGGGAYVLIHLIFLKPITAYAFEHELTHTFWRFIFGARLRSFRVGEGGGSVGLTKSNFLIALDP